MSRSGGDFIFGACAKESDLQNSCVAPFPSRLLARPRPPTLFSLFGGNVKITTVAPALRSVLVLGRIINLASHK